MTAHPKPPKRAKGPIPSKTRALLRQRSSGRCEACHVKPGTDAHHRKFKGRGGSHNIVNLILLCGGDSGLPGGNHSGDHGVAHSALGEARGLSTPSWEDEGGAFTDNYGVDWCLHDDGTKHRGDCGRREPTEGPREGDALTE